MRFQAESGSDPSEIIMHVRMLDNENVRQQEALGIIGVNLLHGAFYRHHEPEALIRSLLDNLTWQRVEVDMIGFSGPAFARVDNRLMALQLVRQDLTEAAMFTCKGEAVQWAEVLYQKPVLVQRGSFLPVTKATMDVLERALEQFVREPDLEGQPPVVLMEMTLRQLTLDERIDETDFLNRADMLSALGKTVLISNFRRFHRLAAYLARYTKRPIGLPVGASKLAEIFDESFYNDSEGGLLGGLGQLFQEPRPALRLSPPGPGQRPQTDSGEFSCAGPFEPPLRAPAGEPFHPGHPQLQPGPAVHPFPGCADENPRRRPRVGAVRPRGHRRDHQARQVVWVWWPAR